MALFLSNCVFEKRAELLINVAEFLGLINCVFEKSHEYDLKNIVVVRK